ILHPDYAMVEELLPPRLKPSLDRTLSSGMNVSGRVVAADGKSPVAKAAVLIEDVPLAVSGDDGTFTIAHAPANWQELEARSGELAGVRARAGTGALAIRVAKSATISGNVRDAKSQLPLVSAEVNIGPDMQSFGRRMRGLIAGGNGPTIESTLTDAKGNFTIAVPPGRYTISAVYPGSVIPQAQLSVVAGQSVNKTLYAAVRARVTGTVVDEDRRPIAGARLAAAQVRRGGPMMMMAPFGGLGPNMTASTAPDGRFVLRSVPTDTNVQIDATKKGLPPSQSSSMKLASGERKSGVTITIPRGVALTGRVVDGNGRAISGVAVEPVTVQGGGFNRGVVRRVVNMLSRDRDDDLVRTGSDGAFAVRVKPGTYDVYFRREGYATRVLHGTAIDAGTKPVDVKLDPSVEITGRVVRAGAGVEGVNVNAIAEDSTASAVTGPDGSFTLSDLTPGQMMVSVTKPDAFIQQIRPTTAPARDMVIELPSGGRITGRVVDKSTHNPVTSFQAGISFTRNAGGMVLAMPPMLKDFTSDDGSFTLENVPPGPTQVVVSAPGYTQGKVPGLNVEDGKTLDNVEVDLETGSRLTGHVTGSDGSPLSGVQVSEVSSDMGPARFMSGARVTTDPNGDYSFDAIEPGQKTFTFSRQGYLSADKTVTVTAGQNATLDAQLSSGMTISGFVVTDAGAPVPNATVMATSASSSMFGAPNATTDGSGAFQMTGLAPGHYTFIARTDGAGQGMLRDFDVSSGGSPRIVIPAGGSITGHVMGLSAADLENTTVFANGTNGNASAPVDGSGAYRIDGAPTGTVHVTARVNGGFGGGGKSSAPVAVQVDAGGSATADIQFKTDTVVQGRVTLNGQPMANVMVTFNPRMGASSQSSGTTDGNGSYSISGLDDGTYNVGVINIDRSSAFSSTYEVHGSGTFDITLKTVTVQGTVSDSASGEPITGASVQFQATQGGFLSSRAVQTDPSGAFYVDNVAAGSYHVIVQKDGYGQATQEIAVTDAPPDPMQFKLAASDGVTINVVDSRDNRQLSANAVRIVDAAGNPVESGGAFRFGGSPEPLKLALAPGQYSVTIAAQGYATKVVQVTSPSQITVGLTPGGTVVFRSKASVRVTVRLIDASGAIYRTFALDPSPLTTTISAIAPGNYTLQVLDGSGAVVNTIPVSVIDGQQNVVDV
ncbi:MAG TPA: carboxypeptidase regulatory-like domain-containing protein, partial [Thermoanaerobaculia bacterium]|nr:carboxypeptidase regulatory-like domain-containing protein [Thermoanaerobaculia bacterium]